MKNKTLPSIRIDENDFEQIIKSIEMFNKNSIVELSVQGFRRLSYKLLSSMILSGEPLPIKFITQHNTK